MPTRSVRRSSGFVQVSFWESEALVLGHITRRPDKWCVWCGTDAESCSEFMNSFKTFVVFHWLTNLNASLEPIEIVYKTKECLRERSLSSAIPPRARPLPLQSKNAFFPARNPFHEIED